VQRIPPDLVSGPLSTIEYLPSDLVGGAAQAYEVDKWPVFAVFTAQHDQVWARTPLGPCYAPLDPYSAPTVVLRAVVMSASYRRRVAWWRWLTIA
jgi:hypothetical protein